MTNNDETLPESTGSNSETNYVNIGTAYAGLSTTRTDTIVFEKAPLRTRRTARAGTVIASSVRILLRAVVAASAPESSLVVSTGFAVIRPLRLDGTFASLPLRSSHFVERVFAHSVGVSYLAISASSLACLPIAFPQVDKQLAVAEVPDHGTTGIDDRIAKVRHASNLHKEFRTALISPAVIGKIDVREAVPR